MVVDIPSGGVGGGHCDGPSRVRCRHWAACEGKPSRPELLCSRMLGISPKMFPNSLNLEIKLVHKVSSSPSMEVARSSFRVGAATQTLKLCRVPIEFL